MTSEPADDANADAAKTSRTDGAGAGDRRYATVAGLALVGTGVVSVLGIVTAEALYPGYVPRSNTISRLGTTAPGEVVRPAATVFNGAIVVSGLLVLLAAYGFYRLDWPRWLVAVVAATGAGVAGVGLFPTQYGPIHAAVALVAFAGGGASAVGAAGVVSGPFRYVSAGLGVVALTALVLFVTVGSGNPLGVGGLERWITYPVQLWATAFGGYLLGDGAAATGAD